MLYFTMKEAQKLVQADGIDLTTFGQRLRHLRRAQGLTLSFKLFDGIGILHRCAAIDGSWKCRSADSGGDPVPGYLFRAIVPAAILVSGAPRAENTRLT